MSVLEDLGHKGLVLIICCQETIVFISIHQANLFKQRHFTKRKMTVMVIEFNIGSKMMFPSSIFEDGISK